MEPLKEFVCDYCGFIINQPSEAVLEYLSSRDASHIKHCSEFKIVHQPGHSPAADIDDSRFCFNHHREKTADLDLEYVMRNPKDILSRNFEQEYGKSDELKEIENRITIPFYEEARKYFDKAMKDEVATKEQLFNSPSPVLLEVVIKKYKKDYQN